jgi:hypothetical protein
MMLYYFRATAKIIHKHICTFIRHHDALTLYSQHKFFYYIPSNKINTFS